MGKNLWATPDKASRLIVFTSRVACEHTDGHFHHLCRRHNVTALLKCHLTMGCPRAGSPYKYLCCCCAVVSVTWVIAVNWLIQRAEQAWWRGSSTPNRKKRYRVQSPSFQSLTCGPPSARSQQLLLNDSLQVTLGRSISSITKQ